MAFREEKREREELAKAEPEKEQSKKPLKTWQEKGFKSKKEWQKVEYAKGQYIVDSEEDTSMQVKKIKEGHADVRLSSNLMKTYHDLKSKGQLLE